jgi:SNF2 family DNA or RNA helicase
LWALPLYLAYVELKEQFPTMEEDGSIFPVLEQPITLLQHNLFSTQIEPTKKLLNRKRALLMAPFRAGKTVMVLTALKTLCIQSRPVDIVIVAPLSLLSAWQAEVTKWLVAECRALGIPLQVEIWWNKTAAHEYLSNHITSIIITSPQVIHGLHKQNTLCDFFDDENSTNRFLILDESFLYQNKETQLSKSAYEFATYFEYCWLLSAMPASKFVDDLFSQLKILLPQIRSYWKFTRRYCLIQSTPWADQVVGNRPNAIEKIIEDFRDIVIQGNYPEDMPKHEPHVITCVMGPKQAAIYKELLTELKVKAETLGTHKPLTLKNLVTLSTRLLQVVSNPCLLDGVNESCKWDALPNLLIPANLPALVWVNHIQTGELIEQMIFNQVTNRVEKLTGQTPKQERGNVVDRFQQGLIDVLIVNPHVGKYGLTLSAAKTAIYLELSFHTEAYTQSLFRGLKAGNLHPAKIITLLATQPNDCKTIDHIAYQALKTSTNLAAKLTVGEFVADLFSNERQTPLQPL